MGDIARKMLFKKNSNTKTNNSAKRWFFKISAYVSDMGEEMGGGGGVGGAPILLFELN